MTTTPSAVFLDTGVFDGQQHNYSSRKFTAFLEQATEKGLEFLLPHPTELEIRRHLVDRAEKAIKAMRDAAVQAPFLRKWKGFPDDSLLKTMLETTAMLDALATQEFDNLLKTLPLIKLNYDGINVARLMEDYDKCRPPFAEGEKRKEFPDAFAIAILAHHAKTNDKHIAVVSNDQDFKRACGSQTRLLYFQNLEDVTASLVRDSDPERVQRLTLAIKVEGAWERFKEQFEMPLRGHLIYIHYHSLLVETSRATGVLLKGFQVIAIGKDECTIAFDATVDAEHKLSWPDPHDPGKRVIGYLAGPSSIQGTAKVTFTSTKQDGNWTPVLKDVSAIDFDNFGLVALTTLPANYEPPPPGLLGGWLAGLAPGGLLNAAPPPVPGHGLLGLLNIPSMIDNPYLRPQDEAKGE